MKDEDRFDGKRENYGDFTKLIEQQLQDVKVMETLQIPTECDSSASDVNNKRLPIQESNIDIFRSHKAMKEQVIHYCDLVWASTPPPPPRYSYTRILLAVQYPTDQ